MKPRYFVRTAMTIFSIQNETALLEALPVCRNDGSCIQGTCICDPLFYN